MQETPMPQQDDNGSDFTENPKQSPDLVQSLKTMRDLSTIISAAKTQTKRQFYEKKLKKVKAGIIQQLASEELSRRISEIANYQVSDHVTSHD